MSKVLLLLGMLLAQPAVPGRIATRPLTSAELASSASLRQVSQIADFSARLQVQKGQAFAVHISSASFRFEPVIYNAENKATGNDVPRCGVFILRGDKDVSFVPTLGSLWTEQETCTDLLGVGFAESDAEMPRILLLYAASSPNYSTREPVVLDWETTDKQYKGNKELSLALTHKGGNASVAGMRKRIAELKAVQK